MIKATTEHFNTNKSVTTYELDERRFVDAFIRLYNEIKMRIQRGDGKL